MTTYPVCAVAIRVVATAKLVPVVCDIRGQRLGVIPNQRVVPVCGIGIGKLLITAARGMILVHVGVNERSDGDGGVGALAGLADHGGGWSSQESGRISGARDRNRGSRDLAESRFNQIAAVVRLITFQSLQT